jgi:cob(I)alamin adenosyltransferase
MVALNRIYTRTGDDGTTGLASGPRRSKADIRVEAYGTVDETNAFLGRARIAAIAAGDSACDALLARIQNDLFDLGADLATPHEPAPRHAALRIVEAQVERLESEIDALNARLAPLRSFVLPGGSPLAAELHVCRTVARRAERHAVALADAEEVNPAAMRYLNRLSDLFFVAARVANADGAEDVLWVPGQNR